MDEKNYVEHPGKAVQNAHMEMGKEKKQWPIFTPPADRGDITVGDVFSAPPCKKRNEMINKWSASVWEAWSGSQEKAREFTRAELNI